MIYLVLILWELNRAGDLKNNAWTLCMTAKLFVRGVIPSFAPFGFYRVWLSVIEAFTQTCYYTKEELENTEKLKIWKPVNDGAHIIEPSAESLNIKKEAACYNLLFGMLYIIAGIVSAYIHI
jgi:hypothetical protein